MVLTSRRHAGLLHPLPSLTRARQRHGLLAHETSVQRVPVNADEVYGRAEFVTKEGDLRTLPCHLPDADPRRAGLDGFYAARLLKR